MGLTLIQRSAGEPPRRNPKVALVLAGGAVSGGAFKVGGLKVLDECLGSRGINDFDMYVGLSAGAFLATSLAQGITPSEMIAALEGTSSRISQLRPIDFYRPNLSEFVSRPVTFWSRMAFYLPGVAVDLISVIPELRSRVGPALDRFLEAPNYTHLEGLLRELFDEVWPKRRIPSLSSLVPSGIFENSALERWLAQNIAAVGASNSFSGLQKAEAENYSLLLRISIQPNGSSSDRRTTTAWPSHRQSRSPVRYRGLLPASAAKRRGRRRAANRDYRRRGGAGGRSGDLLQPVPPLLEHPGRPAPGLPAPLRPRLRHRDQPGVPHSAP